MGGADLSDRGLPTSPQSRGGGDRPGPRPWQGGIALPSLRTIHGLAESPRPGVVSRARPRTPGADRASGEAVFHRVHADMVGACVCSIPELLGASVRDLIRLYSGSCQKKRLNVGPGGSSPARRGRVSRGSGNDSLGVVPLPKPEQICLTDSAHPSESQGQKELDALCTNVCTG
ncbi:uncharacterized protein LOC131592511 isoform X3 [Poecile atricapillus]|uniref:uncharacterized protein LOC131592511 isoform X3 n=1 Tax=Poecile atricapillus TaxID=48891 RepID=UPI002739DEE8|nr:uncharacterized protein LOC131592511 isoform X3 [Poecile atricapillus]